MYMIEFFFFKQKTAYEITTGLEFRRVLFRSRMANHTDRHRIYAIGDIHGCLDKLVQVQSNIKHDLQVRPHARPVIVYLGDYVDRGPNSFGVIENLIAESVALHHTHFIFGNHDELFLSFLKDS